MTIKQAYQLAFCFLDDIYDDDPGLGDTDLAGVLSFMNPNLFSDHMSADPAIFDDWENQLRPSNKEDFSYEEVWAAMLGFLKYRQAQFGENFDYVYEYLNKNKKKWKSWAIRTETV